MLDLGQERVVGLVVVDALVRAALREVNLTGMEIVLRHVVQDVLQPDGCQELALILQHGSHYAEIKFET